MRIHDRLSPLALGLLLAVAGCQTLSGSGSSGPELARYRTQLGESRAAMNRASQEGDVQAVGRALKEVADRFNEIEAKSSAMNLMDREHVAIKIATGRRTMAEAERWIQVNDAEAVRSQVAELDPVIADVEMLLDRAVKSSETPTSDTP